MQQDTGDAAAVFLTFNFSGLSNAAGSTRVTISGFDNRFNGVSRLKFSRYDF